MPPLHALSGTERARRPPEGRVVSVCLQNTPGLSETVAHLGVAVTACPSGSACVGSRCGQPWWSAIADLASLLQPRQLVALGIISDGYVLQDGSGR